MLYAVIAVAALFFGGLGVRAVLDRRKSRGREARRRERQRTRIRDWIVMQWVFGNRANLRITDQRD